MLAIKEAPLNEIELDQIAKMQVKLDENDRAFVSCHEELTKEDEELVDDKHEERLTEHSRLTRAMR